jgi:hypothetical protein
MSGQRGFFDIDEHYAALSAAGDALQRLASVIDFEVFRPVLDAALVRSDRSKGGRPPYDAVVMFSPKEGPDPAGDLRAARPPQVRDATDRCGGRCAAGERGGRGVARPSRGRSRHRSLAARPDSPEASQPRLTEPARSRLRLRAREGNQMREIFVFHDAEAEPRNGASRRSTATAMAGASSRSSAGFGPRSGRSGSRTGCGRIRTRRRVRSRTFGSRRCQVGDLARPVPDFDIDTLEPAVRRGDRLSITFKFDHRRRACDTPFTGQRVKAIRHRHDTLPG